MVYTMTCLILFQVGLPTADLDCDLAQYVDLICGKSLDNDCYHITQYTKKFHDNSKTALLKIKQPFLTQLTLLQFKVEEFTSEI